MWMVWSEELTRLNLRIFQFKDFGFEIGGLLKVKAIEKRFISSNRLMPCVKVGFYGCGGHL